MKKFALLTLYALTLAGCQTATTRNNPAVIVKKPAEPMMCTMQYDPVCGKVANSNGDFNYKIYSNACMAKNSSETVVAVTKGECGAVK